MELGISSYKSKMFYLRYDLPSFLSRFQFAESFTLSAVLHPLCSFVPISHGGAGLHSRWLMWAQDRSKEQLSHFSTAQVVGICFPHSTFFLKGRLFFAICKWNSDPWEFKLISRFEIYITQVCLKHAKNHFLYSSGMSERLQT